MAIWCCAGSKKSSGFSSPALYEIAAGQPTATVAGAACSAFDEPSARIGGPILRRFPAPPAARLSFTHPPGLAAWSHPLILIPSCWRGSPKAACFSERASLQITRSSSIASCWRASDSQGSARANVRRPAPFACQDAFGRVHALRIAHGNSRLAPRHPQQVVRPLSPGFCAILDRVDQLCARRSPAAIGCARAERRSVSFLRAGRDAILSARSGGNQIRAEKLFHPGGSTRRNGSWCRAG
jgi:hypothetical protein